MNSGLDMMMVQIVLVQLIGVGVGAKVFNIEYYFGIKSFITFFSWAFI